MSKQMLLITPKGEVSLIPHDGYDSIRTALEGGYLEGIPLDGKNIMYGDDEAKLKSLTPNLVATMMWHKFVKTGDILCGTIVVVGVLYPQGKQDGEDYDPTPEIVQIAQEISGLREPKIWVESI
jgi:hypothetical protein